MSSRWKNAIERPLPLPDGTELLQQMQRGEYTAEQIVKEYLDRLGRNHPQLNAAVKVFREQALEEAENPRPGALSGLPVSIKETFGIRGEYITAGSKRMPPIYNEEDSEVVGRLREAGAVILARSNVPEFAMSHETDNLIYGRTCSPLDQQRTSGGSSGGEAALIGSGSSVFGVGSDLGGSIRYPAQCCGIVGFKPHSQAVDHRGTFPAVRGYTRTMLAIGPLTRSVRDARLMYNVIARESLPQPRPPAGLRLVIPDKFRMAIKNNWKDLSDGVSQEELELKRINEKISRVKSRIRTIQEMLAALLESDLYKLMTRVIQAAEEGRDLLQEMADELRVKIELRRLRLTELERASNQ